jgi:hypothetical protein
VDFNKFKGLYRKKLRRPQELEKDMRQAFRLLDNTGTGKLSEADLRVLLGSLGEPLTSEEVRTLSPASLSCSSSTGMVVVKVLTSDGRVCCPDRLAAEGVRR